MQSLTKTEYYHIKSGKIYIHIEEYTDDSEMVLAFQESNSPETLGFVYEREPFTYTNTNEQS